MWRWPAGLPTKRTSTRGFAILSVSAPVDGGEATPACRRRPRIAAANCKRCPLRELAYPSRSDAVSSPNRILVGDVGGTHARFAVVEPSTVGPWRVLLKLDLAERFPTFNDALRSYLERAGLTPLPPMAAIAVAGPVVGGTARFTNRGWEISEQALREVGFER